MPLSHAHRICVEEDESAVEFNRHNELSVLTNVVFHVEQSRLGERLAMLPNVDHEIILSIADISRPG